MNPQPFGRIVSTSVWDDMMRNAFLPAEGKSYVITDQPSDYFAAQGDAETSDEFAVVGVGVGALLLRGQGIVGKRIRCKAAGLTGAEKRICNKRVLAKCGRKPVGLGKKAKKKKEEWAKCADSIADIVAKETDVTEEIIPAEKETTPVVTTTPPTTAPTSANTGKMITTIIAGVAVAGIIGLSIYGISKFMKAKKGAAPALAPA